MTHYHPAYIRQAWLAEVRYHKACRDKGIPIFPSERRYLERVKDYERKRRIEAMRYRRRWRLFRAVGP